MRDRTPTSYEEAPDDSDNGSGEDFDELPARKLRKRERNEIPPVTTRFGRSVKKPDMLVHDDSTPERRAAGRRILDRNTRNGKSSMNALYRRETRSTSRNNTPDNDAHSEHSASESDRMDDGDVSYDDEPATAPRRSRRLSGSGSEKEASKEPAQSTVRRSPRTSTEVPKVPMRVRLRCRPGEKLRKNAEKEKDDEIDNFKTTESVPSQSSDDANDDDKLAEKNSTSEDANEAPIRRSLRSSLRKSLNDEGDNVAADDEDFKLPDEESDDDDDFEVNVDVPESDLNSFENERRGMRTRSSNKRRLRTSSPGRASKVARSSARIAASSRNARRSSDGYGNSRKSYPKRTVRRNSKSRTATRAAQRNDALKTYRPRRNNMRPSDFYESESSSGDSSSSEDDFMRSTRAPKTSHSPRATTVPNQTPDFLANPMAIIDDLGLGDARPSRYARRRNRSAQTGRDPFSIDAPGSARGARSASKHPPIEPIKIDLSLTWKDVGGLDHHIRALKEMVFLPLMYPEVFEKFKIEPPKGVLFYGPPGTGKTLCARTLAASCGGDPEDEKLPTHVADLSRDKQTENCKEAPKDGENEVADSQEQRPNRPETSSLPNGVATASVNNVMPDGFIVTPDDNRNPTGASGFAIEANGNIDGSSTNAINSKTVTEAAKALLDAEKEKITVSLLNQPTAAALEENPAQGPAATGATNNTTKTPRRPRVAFFMRNGADCLSKWVGEAERQLRMTFEAAKRHQPSIIFFDEIDGLAPVRSSRQDQIHSSIVSTLLGLMDGLDSRGKIVVIGATNRVDAIDPALRRPGRFDRELIFTLPNGVARRRILDIQTKNWKPSPPPPKVLDLVAQKTVGYCGADIRALCTEATLRALRRRYPQIYDSQDKLLINTDYVRVSTRDFISAMNDIVPASHRSSRTHARPIASRLTAVLSEPLEECIKIIKHIFPQGITPSVAAKADSLAPNGQSLPNSNAANDEDELSDDFSDDEISDINEDEFNKALGSKGRSVYGQTSSSLYERPVLRPRLLLCGRSGLGQAQLGPALLHFLEGCPVHAIDMPSLHTNSSARSPEEALVTAVREACRAVPAVLYLPHLHLWWKTAHESLRTTLMISLRDIPADLPLLFLATAEEDLNVLPTELSQLFLETVTLEPSKTKRREEMFRPLIEQAVACPKVTNAVLRRKRAQRQQVLPKAPPPPPKPITKEEGLRQVHEEDRYIRSLRMEMRSFVEQLLRNRKFKVFWRPVDPATAPDYYQIIKEPMDISKIAAQADKGMYPTVLAMVRDFDLMVKNALQYNPAHTEEGAAILRRAHGLVDIVHAWADNLNPALVEQCNRIVASRIAKATAQKEMMAKEYAAKDEQTQAKAGGPETAAQESSRMDVDEPLVTTPAKSLGSGDADAVELGANQVVVDTPMVGPEEQKQRLAISSMEGDTRQEKANGLPSKAGESDVAPSEEEPYVAAEPSKVEVLRHLIVTVTSGISVDGLEGLHVRCATLLHKMRRSRNRAQVVDNLTNVVMEAREDPAVVGNLVE